MKLLFICNANLHRSVTAEEIFKDRFDTKSAGLDPIAKQQLTKIELEWADTVFVMEDWMRTKISEDFPKEYMMKKIINLDIPDVYSYMQPKLVEMLKKTMKQCLK